MMVNGSKDLKTKSSPKYKRNLTKHKCLRYYIFDIIISRRPLGNTLESCPSFGTQLALDIFA